MSSPGATALYSGMSHIILYKSFSNGLALLTFTCGASENTEDIVVIYVILIIAASDVDAGNVTVNVCAVAVLVPPKFNTATALLP